jgi:hypothetical protein
MLDNAQDDMLFARNSALFTKDVQQEVTAARNRVMGEIDRLNLWRAVAELDVNGFAVIPPEEVGPPAFAEALRKTLLETSQRESGVVPDMQTGKTHENVLSRHGNVELIEPLLHRHSIFMDALLNERMLAIVTYLLGESCTLLSNTGQIKGPGKHYLPLHADQGLAAGAVSLSPTASVCNAVWVLTDYSAENGATCFVPGSHKLCRHPTEAEARDRALYVPLDVKAGSLLIWHGSTWHGAVPRIDPGLRLSIIYFFGRWHLHRGDYFSKLISEEDVARRPARFAKLLRATSTSRNDETPIPPAAIYSAFG